MADNTHVSVLVAGHSQAKYFDQHFRAPNIRVISRSGYRIEEMWEVIKDDVPNYEIIVLHIGANNLWNDTRQQILKKYQELVERIWKYNPEAHVVISGMLPRAENDFPESKKKPSFLRHVNNLAYDINTTIRDVIAPTLRKLTYVGHRDFVKNYSLQRHLLSRDGLHLSRMGSKFVCEDIEVAIKNVRKSISIPPVDDIKKSPSIDMNKKGVSYSDVISEKKKDTNGGCLPLSNASVEIENISICRTGSIVDVKKNDVLDSEPVANEKNKNSLSSDKAKSVVNVQKEYFINRIEPFVDAKLKHVSHSCLTGSIAGVKKTYVSSFSKTKHFSKSLKEDNGGVRKKEMFNGDKNETATVGVRKMEFASVAMRRKGVPGVSKINVGVRKSGISNADKKESSVAIKIKAPSSANKEDNSASTTRRQLSGARKKEISIGVSKKAIKVNGGKKELSSNDKNYVNDGVKKMEASNTDKRETSTDKKETHVNVKKEGSNKTSIDKKETHVNVKKEGSNKTSIDKKETHVNVKKKEGSNTDKRETSTDKKEMHVNVKKEGSNKTSIDKKETHVNVKKKKGSNTDKGETRVSVIKKELYSAGKKESSLGARRKTISGVGKKETSADKKGTNVGVKKEASNAGKKDAEVSVINKKLSSGDKNEQTLHMKKKTMLKKETSIKLLKNAVPAINYGMKEKDIKVCVGKNKDYIGGKAIVAAREHGNAKTNKVVDSEDQKVSSTGIKSKQYVSMVNSTSNCNLVSNSFKDDGLITSKIDSKGIVSPKTIAKSQIGSGPELICTVYDVLENQMSNKDIKTLVSNINEEKISTIPPIRPKAGEIYVFKDNHKPGQKDWTVDGYFWVNKGLYTIPKNAKDSSTCITVRNYWISKMVNDRIGDQLFRRRIYRCNQEQIIIVHYIGDESIYISRPHGRSRSNSGNDYLRTLPSVIRNIRDQDVEKTPSEIYRNLVTSNPVSAKYQGVLNPRNIQQVKRQQFNERQNKKLSHDEIYSSVELYYHLDNFIHDVAIVPELRCIVASSDILKELNKLLALKSDSTMYLSYDTTFLMGDFFVSTLVFRHVLFQGNRIVPAAFFIHDRKSTEVHDFFWHKIPKLVPNLKKKQVIIVTDREDSINNAISRNLPDAQILFCWNHLLQDLKRWLRNHGGTPDDITVYMEDMRSLLHAENENEFETIFQELSLKWSQPMLEYFDSSLKSTILEHSGRWILEKLDVYDPYCGITNNESESMNTVMKRLVKWKEVPLDSIILAFFYLHSFYLHEIQRGLCGVGEFKLKNVHLSARRDPEDVVMPNDVCSPDEIIYLVKGKLDLKQEHQEEVYIMKDDMLPTDNMKDCIDKVSPDATRLQEEIQPKGTSQRSLALAALHDKKVHHVVEAKAFMVEGSKNDKYAVEIYPREKCQCPSTGTCYHILAVRMSIGLEDTNENRVLNLTKLRKNSRRRLDKKAGKKVPRPIDIADQKNVTINAAPDATINETMRDDISVILENEIPVSSSTPYSKIVNPANTEKRDIESNKDMLNMNLSLTESKQINPEIGDTLSKTSEKQENCTENTGNKNNALDKNDCRSAKKRINFDKCDDQKKNQRKRLSLSKRRTLPSMECEMPAKSPKITITSPSETTERKILPKTPKSILKNMSFRDNTENNKTAKKKINFEGCDNLNVIKKQRLSLSKKIRINKENLTEIIEIREDETDQHQAKDALESKNLDTHLSQNPGRSEKRTWIKLGNGNYLRFSDKHDIINEKSLCASITIFTQDILKQQFPYISGMRDTGFVPLLQNDKWTYVFRMMPSKLPSAQIHFTGNGHWVTSIQENVENVYLLDSMLNLIERKQKLPASLELQLSSAYGRKSNKINVIMPRIQQQHNSVDCGVFAIANLVEFCFKRFVDTSVQFDRLRMRDHLLHCLQNKLFQPFPKTKNVNNNAKVPFSLEINMNCNKCSLSDIFDDMISCENCSKWFHNSCVGLDDDFRDSFTFKCDICQ